MPTTPLLLVQAQLHTAWIDIKSRWNDDDPRGWNFISNNSAFLWVSEKDGWRHIYKVTRDGKETLLTIGNYDIEIPVIPKILVYNINIKQSTTTTVQIPIPGLVTFLMIAPGYGSIYLREKDKPLRWVYNLNTTLRNESLHLQPGSYSIVYRPLNAKQSIYTLTRTFDIVSSGSKVIELY